MAYLSRHERREQIVNAVVDIVGREGLAAATVRRIALELDCSPGQIHHHFASAYALRAEALRETWARLEPKLSKLLRSHPPRERLVILLGHKAATICPDLSDPLDVAKRLWSEAWDAREAVEVREEIAESLRRLHRVVLEALLEGQESGAFAKTLDMQHVASRLVASMHGLNMWEEMGLLGVFGQSRDEFVAELLAREGL